MSKCRTTSNALTEIKKALALLGDLIAAPQRLWWLRFELRLDRLISGYTKGG